MATCKIEFFLGLYHIVHFSIRQCAFMNLYTAAEPLRDITKFSRHHPMVELEDKLENGYKGCEGGVLPVSVSTRLTVQNTLVCNM